MKKTVTGKEAYDLLKEATAYIIMDDNMSVTYGQPNEEDGYEIDEYELDLSYNDSEGQEYQYRFLWQTDDVIHIENNQLFLAEGDGSFTPIKILEVKQL